MINTFNIPLKTVLVTGCCGMIGFATTQLLLKSNYKVIGIDCFSMFNFSHHLYQKECLEILQKDANFTYIDEDISNNNKFKNLNLSPDIIIHLAAFAGITFSFENPVMVLDNNQKGLISCLDLAKDALKNKEKTIPIFFASSSSVYGHQNLATVEATDLTPLSIYALSKKHNEDIAKMYNELYGVSAIGLRFFTVYGPYNRCDMLVHRIFQSIESKVSLTLHKKGEMKRSFTFNQDVAQILLKFVAVSLATRFKIFDIYNVGNNSNIDLLKFISLFEYQMSSKANLKLSPNKPIYEPDTTNCDNSKVLKLFPDIKFTSFEDGVAQTVQWYKERKN